MIAAAVLLICLLAMPASAQTAPVSLGKTYQFITEASTGYPDSEGYKLTNGIYASPVPTGDTEYYYKSPEYVGLNQSAVDENGNFVIVLDLGSVMDDLSAFELSYLNETDIGIYAPPSVTFYVSETRNGNYTSVGTRVTDEPKTAGVSQTNIARVIPEGPVTGQFVMIEIKHLGSFTDDEGNQKTAGWVFIDEISVFGATPEAPPVSPDQTQDVTSPGAPQTGDNPEVIAYLIIAFASLLMIIGFIRYRRTREPK